MNCICPIWPMVRHALEVLRLLELGGAVGWRADRAMMAEMAACAGNPWLPGPESGYGRACLGPYAAPAERRADSVPNCLCRQSC